MTAAGVPPRKTIATTRARKLPEIASLDSVGTAVRSLKTEKPSRMTSSGRFQSPLGASQTAAATAAQRARKIPALTARVGRLLAIVSFVGSDPAQLQGSGATAPSLPSSRRRCGRFKVMTGRRQRKEIGQVATNAPTDPYQTICCRKTEGAPMAPLQVALRAPMVSPTEVLVKTKAHVVIPFSSLKPVTWGAAS